MPKNSTTLLESTHETKTIYKPTSSPSLRSISSTVLSFLRAKIFNQPKMVLFSLSMISFVTLSMSFFICSASLDDLTGEDKLIDLFESWMLEHGKTYKSVEEKIFRFEFFKANLKYIEERNKVVTSYWLGLNEFTDLSHEEFKNMYLGLKVDMPKQRGFLEDFSYRDGADLPNSVDWRKKGAVTHVKNQGACGCTAKPEEENW